MGSSFWFIWYQWNVPKPSGQRGQQLAFVRVVAIGRLIASSSYDAHSCFNWRRSATELQWDGSTDSGHNWKPTGCQQLFSYRFGGDHWSLLSWHRPWFEEHGGREGHGDGVTTVSHCKPLSHWARDCSALTSASAHWYAAPTLFLDGLRGRPCLPLFAAVCRCLLLFCCVLGFFLVVIARWSKRQACYFQTVHHYPATNTRLTMWCSNTTVSLGLFRDSSALYDWPHHHSNITIETWNIPKTILGYSCSPSPPPISPYKD